MALPELHLCEQVGGEPEIFIKLGKVPKVLPLKDVALDKLGDGIFLVTVRDVAWYLVRHGREVLVEPFDRADEQDVRRFLLGLVFGFICYQRRLLPLHASTVKVGRRCVAFTGPSGAGKSTLAAFMSQRGYPLIGDDFCVLSKNTDGAIIVYPRYPLLKLWEDSLKALKQDKENLLHDWSWQRKYPLLLETGFTTEPLPLWRIYILQVAEASHQEKIEQIRGLEALTAIAENSYQPILVKYMNLIEQHFKFCATITKAANVYRLKRPLCFDRMDNIVEQLEFHWHSPD